MAVDRWFAGIPLGANVWHGGTIVAVAGKDTYMLNFSFQTDASTKLAEILVIGTPDDDGIKQILAHNPAVGAQVDFGHLHFHKLKQGSIAYSKGTAAAGATWIVGFGNGIVLSEISGVRKLERVLGELTALNAAHFDLCHLAPGTNEWVLERQINPATTPIIQPVHQATPAVADELFVVSDDAADTLAGTGMQKCKIDYYDASFVEHTTADIEMAGLTPVDIISLYADVYIIKKMYGTQWGSSGINEGNVFLQDTAV